MLCGHLNAHLKLIGERLEISLSNRGNRILSAPDYAWFIAEALIRQLYEEISDGLRLSVESLHLRLQQADLELLTLAPATETTLQKGIKTKRDYQAARAEPNCHVESIRRHDLNFGVGPAGTGKTYLAVACAVEALLDEEEESFSCARLLRPVSDSAFYRAI